MRFDGDGWVAELAPNWESEEEEDCVAFFDPDGVGALEISTAHKEDGPIDAEELEEMATKCAPDGVELSACELGCWEGLSASFEDAGDAWRIWCVRSGSCALFITYNCNTDDRGTEDPVVDELLRSIRLLDN